MTDRRTDFELVAYTIGRDHGALAAVYDRFADEVFDLCCSVTRDRGLAEDATAETFLAVWARIEQLGDPWQLRLWVLAIARRAALIHAGRRQSSVPITSIPAAARTDDAESEASTEAPPSAENQQLAWDAAASLSPTERVVLDLQLRRHLKATPRARVLGLTIDEGRPLTAEARNNLDATMRALAIAHTRRSQCPELARALGSWDGTDTPKFRKDLRRHLERCEPCRTAGPYGDAYTAFAAIPPSLPQPALRGRVLDALDDPPPIHGWSPETGGFPPASAVMRAAATAAAPRRRPGSMTITGIAVAVVLVLGALGWFVTRALTDNGATTSTTSLATTTTTAPASDTTAAPPIGPKPLITNAEVTPPRISSTECPDSAQVLTVTATATDDLAVTGATVTASRAGARTEVAMTLTDGVWRADVGPFGPGTYGSITLRVAVVDADGNEDTTLRYAQLSRACV